ncbi:hypothetical protein GJAV_G00262530 [Gymnothorax javanicus]|nr:hypothetical protein GJAV_G00262530 [Gymnothorax javanicus]
MWETTLFDAIAVKEICVYSSKGRGERFAGTFWRKSETKYEIPCNSQRLKCFPGSNGVDVQRPPVPAFKPCLGNMKESARLTDQEPSSNHARPINICKSRMTGFTYVLDNYALGY